MYSMLLVDDDPAILEMLSLALERAGVAVHTALNLDEAFDVIDDHTLQVAVLDVHLTPNQGREGLQVLQFLRIRQPPVPAIVITGARDPYLLNRAYHIGASYFMRKPLDLTELERQLRLLGLPAAPTPPARAGDGLPTWPSVRNSWGNR